MSRLVAQRYTAPVKTPPAQSARFRTMKADVAGKKTRLAAHAPAAAESKASQDAAVAPPDDKEAQGKAANAEKMNAAKPGEFDKKAFIDAVNKAIDSQAPKNLDEADKFAKSGKADQVKAEVDGKVTDGKESSAKDIDTATKAPPDTSAAKDKDVTPLTPDAAPGNPGAPSATDAVPEKQPAAVTDFSEGPAGNDQAMADAEVTEEQLAKGNEPEFNEALSAKKTSEADAAKAPAKGKAAEDQQLSTAKQNAAASGAQAMAGLTSTRAAAGKQVDGGKNDTKSKDEKKRAEVTAKLQKVYDGTKKDVEDTLSGLDKKVDSAFTSGEKSARDAFTADHKSRMKKYKDKRYSGLMGKGRWIKDKFAGLPKAANDLYQESRKLYVSKMQTVISSVADIIGAELGKAKARIAKGRTELKAEVDKLPADLKQFGEEAAKDFAGKFDDLEATVNEKSEQLVQDLAQKYTAALNKIDEEIKKLQEANKGLIDKAKDAIVGAIKTINELKNLLLGILAKAASAIMKIIKDPIGFLGNLVKAVGAGLNLFITNIADHLKTGVVSWLLGTAVKAGLDLPAKFDLKGIIQLIGSMLGLTWDNIRTRVTRKGVPDEAMSAVETSVPVAKNLAAEGPAGAVKEIQAEAGDLKATILGKLTTYLIPTVLIAGITWIISLLNPASAFVRAVKGIIDIVTFIVTQGAQIADFVNAVLDAVIAIANGGQAGVPKLIEAALASSVPLLIGFLAALLGIGGLANKVKSVFQSVSRPVTRAIDKIVDFIAKKGKALWNKLKGKNGKGTEGKNDKKGENKPAEKTLKRPTVPVHFEMAGHPHTLTFSPAGDDVNITMASNDVRPLAPLFSAAHTKIDHFRYYMESIEDPDVKAKFEAHVLPWIESFTHANIMTFRSIYKEQFPASGPYSRTTDQTRRVRRMTAAAEEGLQNLITWATRTGIPDLDPKEIARVIEAKGAEIWKEEFYKKKEKIDSIVSGFNYKNNPILYRGSMETGWRGIQKGSTHFDPKNFDVDMYVIDPQDFDRITKLKGGSGRKKWIKGDAVYAPELFRLSIRVGSALGDAFPEVKGIGDSKVILRRSEPGQ
ncbi:hypothetical protein ACFV07_08535 [Streptomyces anulatus]|uniref:phage tail protein n=1 Tax=Streptomyces anulatus TaxID=1892 RepID=UPI0036874516